MKRLLSGALALSMISGVSGFQNVHAVENHNIINGFECGMILSEISETAVIHSEESHFPINENYNKYSNYYNIENVFDINMKTHMFAEYAYKSGTEHSDSDILICYGYHIGEYYNPETEKYEYPYSETELSETYNSIYNTLVSLYGDGTEWASDYNVSKGYTWDTEYGQIWFVFGMNMWGSDGINKITLSCSDFSVIEKNPGDVNGDGVIDSSDASDILADYAVTSSGGVSTLDKDIADVNKDKQTDSSDSSLILAYYAYISAGGNATIQKFKYI